MRSTDIGSLVARVVERYTAQSRDRQITVSGPREAVAPADRQLFDLAITQLLDNAFKYSTSDTPVTVSIEVDGGFIDICVCNEGSSIAPQEQERIFERFYRGSEVRKLISGAGLGLYVARKIAVAHGGTLDLDKSAPSDCVVFCFKLPVHPSNGNHHVTVHS